MTIKPIHIKPIVKEALKLLRSTIPKNIAIQQEISESKIVVKADPTEIYEIIMNLCTNAYHAMESSGGCLGVNINAASLNFMDQNQLDLLPGRYCILTVSDTGVGIPDKIVDQIFEPYFTTKKIGKGSGLGLAVVHGIVKNYRGSVSIQSQVGKGTVFKVFLPLVEPMDEEEGKQNGSDFSRGTEHVLLVDDETAIVNVGIKVLGNLGYTVTGRTSSEKALEDFKTDPEKYDIVVTDMTMPGMVGTKLSKEIKQIRPDIPVIICTGFSNQIDAKKASSMGFQGFILKPFLAGDLSVVIRQVLDR